jgi:hypothetical protein
MAKRGRPTITKRQKELARGERTRLKEEKRAQRQAEKEARPEPEPGVDPDIAGIVPGPQPPRTDW